MKNKFLSIVGCTLLLMLAACGAEPQTTDSGNAPNSSQDDVNNEEELTVTIVDEAFASWKRNDAFMLSYSAELKNENSVPVDIQRMYVEFLDEEGEVFEGMSFDPIPYILMPNETAYVVDSYEIRDDDLTDPHDKKINKVDYAAGLYNDQGELLAVLRKSDETNLGKGDTMEFETFYPYLSDEIYGKVTKVKAIAFEYPYNY